MLPSFACLLALFSISSMAVASSNDEVLSEEFCRQFPSLHLCRLHENLQGSLVELQYLLQDTDGAQAASAGLVQKRKSAFVRFGKRSEGESEETTQEMEKRKSAFVRFGRSLGEADKRKSQYIRFGRK